MGNGFFAGRVEPCVIPFVEPEDPVPGRPWYVERPSIASLQMVRECSEIESKPVLLVLVPKKAREVPKSVLEPEDDAVVEQEIGW